MRKSGDYLFIWEERGIFAAEPAAAYGYAPSSVQALRNRIVDTVNETKDENLHIDCCRKNALKHIG